MSDYVSRLVERSMGAANVVRPGAASLFEPRDAVPQQLLAEVDVESSGSLRPSPSGPHAPAGEADDLAGVRADDPRPAPAGQERGETGIAAVEEAPAPALHPLRDPVEPAKTDAPARAERATAVVVRAESRAPRSERSPRGRTAPGRTEAPEPLSMLPPISPAPEPNEPPVVHVTIGRVDVRAVQSVPPAPPAHPRDREPEATPQQTLGEYLRKGARP